MIKHKTIAKNILVLILLFAGMPTKAQRLEKFESSKTINGDRIPYTSQTSFFGCINDTIFLDSNTISSTVYYFYLPDSATEIGVRVISPVPDITSPRAGDSTDSTYYVCSPLNKYYFDPAIILQKGYLKTSKLPANIMEWITLANNDDSKDLAAQPNFLFRNALIRKQPRSKKKNAKFSPGLYRVVLSNDKLHFLIGTFLLQIGIEEKNKKLTLYGSMEELQMNLNPK